MGLEMCTRQALPTKKRQESCRGKRAEYALWKGRASSSGGEACGYACRPPSHLDLSPVFGTCRIFSQVRENADRSFSCRCAESLPSLHELTKNVTSTPMQPGHLSRQQWHTHSRSLRSSSVSGDPCLGHQRLTQLRQVGQLRVDACVLRRTAMTSAGTVFINPTYAGHGLSEDRRSLFVHSIRIYRNGWANPIRAAVPTSGDSLRMSDCFNASTTI